MRITAPSPTLFAATAPDAVPGGYYGPDGFLELKGFPEAVVVPPQAQNPADADRLWFEAERLTNITLGI
jgi:hypothetical protein